MQPVFAGLSDVAVQQGYQSKCPWLRQGTAKWRYCKWDCPRDLELLSVRGLRSGLSRTNWSHWHDSEIASPHFWAFQNTWHCCPKPPPSPLPLGEGWEGVKLTHIGKHQ